MTSSMMTHDLKTKRMKKKAMLNRGAAPIGTGKNPPHKSGHAKKPTCLTLYTNGGKVYKMKEDWDDDELSHNYIYFCAKPENWEEIKAKEQKYPWRAALRDMYHDIATLSTVDNLKILNLLPGKTSFWQKDEWVRFLGNLEYLELKADDEGLLGSAGSLYLAPGSMPALRVLHVASIAVTSGLTNFLQEVHGTLSKIRITECVSLAEDTYDNKQPTWADVWKPVRQAIKAPTEVVFVPTRKQPITQEEYYHREDNPYKPPSDEEEKIEKFWRMAKEEDGFCIWPYVWVDSQYGFALPDWEMNIARLESGVDNLEFKLLME
ncbi:unnamed protein product [Fusarium equiseti]|uniref:Uncharacterized protein n=1 Tax=Fusarium equiseti TaxID=61235 RepID=A0A8J2IZG8_FUSEQ|nr:unnamed protein product [Fusarium equiseti]